MPVIQKTDSVATTVTVENALSGSAFEFARTNQLVSIGVVCDTAGCFATITNGSDVLLEESEVDVKSTYPVIPDNMYYNDVATQGDRLVIRLRNPTGGTVVFKTVVQITPI
jgi:hypothetical protein